MNLKFCLLFERLFISQYNGYYFLVTLGVIKQSSFVSIH